MSFLLSGSKCDILTLARILFIILLYTATSIPFIHLPLDYSIHIFKNQFIHCRQDRIDFLKIPCRQGIMSLFVTLNDLLREIEEGVDVPVQKYIQITNWKTFLKFIEANSSYIKKYKWLYIYKDSPQQMPHVTNIFAGKFEKIEKEVSNWVRIRGDLDGVDGVDVSSDYAFFVESGLYKVGDHVVKVPNIF